MKSLSAWKIRREIKRLIRQLWELPISVGSYFLSACYYDLILSRKVVHISGFLAKTEKIAIYLIYPNLGLLHSHMHGLRHLVAKGYAPVVVSNLPLNATDREQLLPYCHTYIERPNFGYDFGGYRDGVLAIMNDLPNLERLLLLNDSVWFPLPGSSDWIEESENFC